jgi:hypothetical protein
MGLRLRLKASFDTAGFSEPVRVILAAMKRHGIIVADNGSNWYISGAPDDRWDDDILGELKSIAGSNFEAVRTVDENGDPIYPVPAVEAKAFAKVEKEFLQIAPNPFCNKTYFGFSGDRASSGRYRLAVYDMRGRMVRAWEGEGDLQKQSVNWDGTDAYGRALEAGVYIVRLRMNGAVYHRSVILIK